MSRRLAPFSAALLLLLGGCAQSDLGGGFNNPLADSPLAEDVIFDSPQAPVAAKSEPQSLVTTAAWSRMTIAPEPKAPDARPQPAPVLKTGGWDSSFAPPPAPPRVAPPVVAWGAAAVTPYMPPGSGPGPYLLNTGDKLRVFVYGQPSLSRLYTVDQTGNIAVPLIGNVRARDRTTTDLARAITTRLAREFVRDPQVTVDVVQNRPFFILGEVRLPGQYPFVSDMTVETAVAIAGGYTERASERCFRITRRINGLVDQIEAPSDYPLLPGDTVYVYERFL